MQDEEYAEDPAHQVPSVHQDIDNIVKTGWFFFTGSAVKVPAGN